MAALCLQGARGDKRFFKRCVDLGVNPGILSAIVTQPYHENTDMAQKWLTEHSSPFSVNLFTLSLTNTYYRSKTQTRSLQKSYNETSP